MDAKKIGIYLKEKRITIKLTQVELSEQLGVTHQAISRWETGESIPDVIMLEKLSKLYKVSIDEIVKQEMKSDIVSNKIESKGKLSLGLTITMFLYCVSVFVSYLSFHEISNWLWVILVISLFVISALPYLFIYLDFNDKENAISHNRFVLDVGIISMVLAVLISITKMTDFDFRNYEDLYFIIIPLGMLLLSSVDYIYVYSAKSKDVTFKQYLLNDLNRKSLSGLLLITSVLIFILSVLVFFPMLRADKDSGLFGFFYFTSALAMVVLTFYKNEKKYLLVGLFILFDIAVFIYITTLYGNYIGDEIETLYSKRGLISMISGVSASLMSLVLIGLFVYRSSKRIAIDYTLLLYAVYLFWFTIVRTMIQTVAPLGYSPMGDDVWIHKAVWDSPAPVHIVFLVAVCIVTLITIIIKRRKQLLK